MAVQDPGLDIGYLQANSDLSALQFTAVIISGADLKVDAATVATAGTPILGILQNKPTANQAADVRLLGVSKAKTGASYSRGVPLMIDGSGRLIAATSTNQAVAYSLEASGGANEIRSVFVNANGQNT
jgi:hypothetical protein